MNLNDLFLMRKIDPRRVIVLRHRPQEPQLRKVLPWLAIEKPEVFNAYQRIQKPKLEKAIKQMSGSGYVVSFIGHQPGKALFVGLYSICGARPVKREEYWKIPENEELKAFGMEGFSTEDPRETILWLELELTDFCASWKGRLIIEWPPPEVSWWRRAHKNTIPIFAISEESLLVPPMPDWNSLILAWKELEILPSLWRVVLSQWRGIYYLFDVSIGKGYVGSAYGEENLYGRWLSYAQSGHGGNKLLKRLDPNNFRFSILQRVSPDMSAEEIIRLESAWKERLHTKYPYGLNDN